MYGLQQKTPWGLGKNLGSSPPIFRCWHYIPFKYTNVLGAKHLFQLQLIILLREVQLICLEYVDGLKRCFKPWDTQEASVDSLMCFRNLLGFVGFFFLGPELSMRGVPPGGNA